MDLTEGLYQELVVRDSSLKKLEEDSNLLNSDKPSSKFDIHNGKSERYYASANAKTRSIQDSVLRKKIELLIANSKKGYESKIAEFNALSKLISRNETTLSDSHSILKIRLALPIIDKYQNENAPHKDDLNSLIQQQEKLIDQTKKLTPKY